MNPSQQSDQFKPKYRQFHPQSTVWVQNPFDHDVVFQVADEHNTPYSYKLPSHKVSELPGGAVATLGVKAIVDELIQNNKGDNLRIWDADVRAKYEKDIILRVKEASNRNATASGPVGDIDLSVKSDAVETPSETELIEEEQAFPELQPTPAASEVTNIANASVAGLKDNATIESD